MPAGATSVPPTVRTSSASRSSISMPAPVGRREIDRRQRAPRRRTGCRDAARAPRARRYRSCSRRHRSRRCGPRRRRRDRPRPRAINDAAATSTTSVASMPSRSSSHAVSRAPCSTGRVSSTHTCGALAALDRGADHTERGAVADARERTRVAVREHLRVDAARSRRRARRCAGCARHRRRRCAARPRARRRHHRRRRRSSARSTPHREVDRGRPRRRKSFSQLACTCRDVRDVRAASATPYAPAAPSAGAPRIASVAIASHSCVDRRCSRRTESAPAASRWSSTRTTPSPPARSSAGSGRASARLTAERRRRDRSGR